MKLTFWGAARTVTGSMHLVELESHHTLLLDCGLFQGRRAAANAINGDGHRAIAIPERGESVEL